MRLDRHRCDWIDIDEFRFSLDCVYIYIYCIYINIGMYVNSLYQDINI
jgi:hypothetical protein